MNIEEIPSTVCKKRFKGLENFLRRVAFNLGNTQSQTEVKIISCIPIDVTDLQQKIIHLEKQLVDATAALHPLPTENPPVNKSSKSSKLLKVKKSDKQSIHTAITEPNFPTLTSEAVSCKALDCDRCTSPAHVNSKRKSNVSYILTDLDTAPVTPSKDYSEILQGTDPAVNPNNMDHYYSQEGQPNNIDQYYTQEEHSNNIQYYTQPVNPKKMDHCCSQEVTPDKRDHYVTQAVTPNNRDHYVTQTVTPNNRDHYYAQEVKPKNRDHYFTQALKPNRDHYCSQEENPFNRDHYCSEEENTYNRDHYCSQEANPYNRNHYWTSGVNPNNFNNYYISPKMSNSKTNNQRKRLFKSKKKVLNNKKGTSPCVYYTHTYSSPFLKSNVREEVPEYDRNGIMSRSYLAAMVSRQYKPEVLGDNISLQSQFSSPICRDVQQHNDLTCPYESDLCSCCHGQFHNLDEHANQQNHLQTYMLHQMNQGSAFYDTSQYDLVPVKEKSAKIRKDFEKSRNKDFERPRNKDFERSRKKDFERPRETELKPHIDMKCWPGNVRTKYHYHSLYPLPTINYYNTRPRADYIIRDKGDSYGRKMPVTYHRLQPVTRILTKRRKEIYRRERPVHIETSKSCSIEFGNVYPKKISKMPKKLKSLQPMPMAKKNAECLTTVINNSECQTEMSTIEVNSNDTKTEATLNQIKSILKSVLAEVKGSSQTKELLIQNKKDAVVQKGPSRNNMQASTFMNSITYSRYAMNPTPFVTSCSRQMNSSQYCCPYGGMKCFHNFPVFIHNPGGRHMCSSCYRSSQLKPSCMKQATTTATNTEQIKQEHSKETEKLIKEIYKSMALTMDFPNKDTSLSEYDEMDKSLHNFTPSNILKTEPKKQPKIIKNVVQAVSELFMKKDMIDTSDTFNSTIECKLPSHEVSMRSQVVASTDTEFRMRDMREKYVHTKKQSVVPEVEEKTVREAMVQNANNIIDSETSSSEPDTSTTVVGRVKDRVPELKHLQKKEKDGLFTKMLKSVRLFKPKEKQKKCVEKYDSEEVTTSDSDDYQTVYSQKIEKHPRIRNRTHNLSKRKIHSKISYNKSYQRDRSPDKKRSPYMEQEYRRYWDETLMFQNDRPRYSSERQSSVTPQKPAYYRSYEARTALVEPATHIPKTEPNIRRENGKEGKFNVRPPSKGMAWLKKHKMGIRCGEQWKKFLLES